MTTIKRSEMQWQPSLSTPGWEFIMLSGDHAGPFSILCRCSSAISFAPWISDGLVEYYVLRGKLIMNGIDLEQGDYGCVDACTDGVLNTKASMEAICIAHGKVIWAKEIFDSLCRRSLSDQEAREFLALPWIDHLRRHARDEDLGSICDWIDTNPGEALSELCISAARNLMSPRLIQSAKRILANDPGLSLRITATLYLASKGEIDDSQWLIQVGKMREHSEDLLQTVRTFYGASNNQQLVDSIRQRIASGGYDYNRPFYDMLIGMLHSHVGVA